MPKMVAAECIKLKRNSILGIPVFLLLGWLIPCMMYDNAVKCSIVDQLRDAQ